MIKLTRAQMLALKRVWEREQDTVKSNLEYELSTGNRLPERYTVATWPSYLAMRRKVQPFCKCVMIESRGVWLGIEPDGYTHS